MAIAFDVASDNGHDVNASQSTHSHTCTGTDLFLVVFVAPGDAVLATRTVSGVTYGGQALTHANADADAGFERTEIWYKIGPLTGANDVVVSMGGGCDSLDVYAASFTGVDQASQPDNAHGGAQTAESPITEPITTNADNSWVVSVCQSVDVQTSGLSGGQNSIGSLNGGWTRASYSGPKTPAGAVTHGYTVPSASDGAMSLISFDPAVGGVVSVNANYKTLLGVGF